MRHVILAAIATLGLSFSASSASALCIVQEENGNWQNVEADTRSITRADLVFLCQDQVLNGQPYPPGSPWTIRLWGACSPSDCAWDTVDATRLDNGWIFGRIDQGFAKREVWAKMNGSRLRVYVRTDFTDPSRADYNSDSYFVR